MRRDPGWLPGPQRGQWHSHAFALYDNAGATERIGTIVSVAARTSEEAQPYSQALLFLFLALGPVLIPSESLPIFMRVNPATYGASALRHVLLGPIDTRLWVDISLLTGLSVISLYLVDRKMAWRHQRCPVFLAP